MERNVQQHYQMLEARLSLYNLVGEGCTQLTCVLWKILTFNTRSCVCGVL